MKRRRVEDEKDAPGGAKEDGASFCRIEGAKSGRAKCRICGEKIAKGALRVGKEIDLGEHLGGRLGVAWYHIRCTVLRSGGADVEAVSGFGDLSAAQQEVARSGGERTESVDAGMATGSVDASRATGIPPCPAIGTAATTVNSAVAASACKFLLGGRLSTTRRRMHVAASEHGSAVVLDLDEATHLVVGNDGNGIGSPPYLAAVARGVPVVDESFVRALWGEVALDVLDTETFEGLDWSLKDTQGVKNLRWRASHGDRRLTEAELRRHVVYGQITIVVGPYYCEGLAVQIGSPGQAVSFEGVLRAVDKGLDLPATPEMVTDIRERGGCDGVDDQDISVRNCIGGTCAFFEGFGGKDGTYWIHVGT